MKKTKTTRSFFRWGSKPKEDSRHDLLEASSKVTTTEIAEEHFSHGTIKELPRQLNDTAQKLIKKDTTPGPPSILSTQQAVETPPEDMTKKEFKLNDECLDSDEVTPKGTYPLKWVYI
jgi:hypothetical protein